MSSRPSRMMGLAAAALLVAGPAVAQKAKNTVRYPIEEAGSTIDRYEAPGSFANHWEPTVFDNLISFDPKKGQFVPAIAKSWAQPDELTYEFELRDDVKFHDGQKLTADDAVYTLTYLTDPKVKLRYKQSWSWIKSIEKTAPNKFRIVAKQPDPDGLMWLAFGTPIYPKHLHEPIAASEKSTFGAKPVGTGPYRIVQMDKNVGVVAERYADFVPGAMKARPQVGRIVAEPMEDAGTQVAALLTDRVDVVANLPIDQAMALKDTGRFDVMLSPPRLGYIYLMYPTFAWTNAKQLADPRVRKAIVMAIDRKLLLESVYGPLAGQVAPTEGLCSKEQLGCGYTQMVPDYDPAGAKKLLAEAGYPDGFDVTISAYRDNAAHVTAISGMLRKIGIRAEVRAVHSTQRLKLIKEGAVQIGYWGWSGGNMFTVSPQIVRHLQSGEAEDPGFAKLADAPFSIMDDAERRKASARAFDYLNEKAYTFAMIPNREIFTMSKEVGILNPDDLRPMQISPHEFIWK
jgi:peptide/nickel transport system substrate-binding protein